MQRGTTRKELNLFNHKGERFAIAPNVFFVIHANPDDLMGQIVIAGRPEPLTREQLDGHRADVFQQTFADRNARSEEQTN